MSFQKGQGRGLWQFFKSFRPAIEPGANPVSCTGGCWSRSFPANPRPTLPFIKQKTQSYKNRGINLRSRALYLRMRLCAPRQLPPSAARVAPVPRLFDLFHRPQSDFASPRSFPIFTHDMSRYGRHEHHWRIRPKTQVFAVTNEQVWAPTRLEALRATHATLPTKSEGCPTAELIIVKTLTS